MSAIDIRERILELGGTEGFEEIIRSAMQAEMRGFWTTMPVKVMKDSDGKTAMIQPTVKAQVRDADGNTQHVDMPLVEGVVHHMGGGGTTSTVAIKEGNEGTVLFASRAIDAWHQSGGSQQAVDTRSHHLSDGIFMPGVRSQPRDLKDISTEATETRTDDGKHRQITHPDNGIKTSINNGKTVVDVNAKTGAVEATGKTVTIKAGEVAPGGSPATPNTTDRYLNEQLKGLSARVGQVEKTAHALFDVTSRLRQLTQIRVPEVAALSGLLSQDPGGLDAIVGAVEGKAMAYLQTQIQQALGMFSNPTLGGVASVLGGGIEAQIAKLQGQIGALITANPALGALDDLQRQMDAVMARGAAPAVQAGQIQPIQDQIGALLKDNPIASVVQDLQGQLKKLLGSAGGGVNFLEPQKMLAQGVTKSVHFSES